MFVEDARGVALPTDDASQAVVRERVEWMNKYVYRPMAGVYTRLDGLRQLGLAGELPMSVQHHFERCTHLAGWKKVQWTTDQTTDFVGHFLTFHEIQNSSKN